MRAAPIECHVPGARAGERGFTLIEVMVALLLTVIAVIAHVLVWNWRPWL